MGLQGLRATVNKPKPAASSGTSNPCRRASCSAGRAPDRPAGVAPRRPRSTCTCLTIIQNRPMLTRAYRIFGLRHGTMMIAIHDLMWSLFVVFLLVLAAAHVREVSHMVEDDMVSRLADRLGSAHHLDHGRGQGQGQGLKGHSGLEHLGAQLGKGHPDFEQHQSHEHAALEQLAKEHLARGGSPNGILLGPPSALEQERRERARAKHQGEDREATSAFATDDANLTHPELEGYKNVRKCGRRNSSYYMHYVEFAYSQAKSMINLELATNESRLNDGVHFATMLSVVMVIGICAAGIDMIASMMLLVGAMLNVRQLMMPWLSLRLMELVVLLGSTFVSIIFWARGVVFCRILFLDFLIFCEFVVIFYHWLVAFSLHEQLCRMERTGAVHHTTRAAGGPGGLGPCKWCAMRASVQDAAVPSHSFNAGIIDRMERVRTVTIDMSSVPYVEKITEAAEKPAEKPGDKAGGPADLPA